MEESVISKEFAPSIQAAGATAAVPVKLATVMFPVA
jgi:hypothetical protein